MEKAPYRVLIADDEYFIRKKLCQVIDWEDLSLAFAGEAGNGLEVLELMPQGIDILLLDIQMPLMDGLKTAEEIYDSYPKTKIIILSGYDAFIYAKKAVEFGVIEYLLKPIRKEELTASLQKAIKALDKDNEYERLHLKELKDNVPDFVKRDIIPSDILACDRIKTYISGHFTELDLRASVIAEYMGMNLSYLGSIFRKVKGQSISQYITTFRMEKATVFLLQDNSKISDVAEMVGYGDVFYFSKKFKSCYGVSPKEYVQQIRNKEK